MAVSRLRQLVAGTTVLLLVLPTVASAQSPDLERQLADREDQREQGERELGEVRTREQGARGRLADADAVLAEAEAELQARRDALTDAQAVLEAARAEADAAAETAAVAESEAAEARAELRRVTAELDRTEAELDEQQLRLDQRVRAAFKYGQVSFAEAFAGVRDIADFLNSSTYVGKVMANDRDLVEEVLRLLDRVQGQRARAQALRAEAEGQAATAQRAAADAERKETRAGKAAADVERLVADQEAQTEVVAQRRAQQQSALEAILDDRQAIEDHLAAVDADAARLEGEITALARRRAQEAARRAEEQRAREAADRERQESEGSGDPGGGGGGNGGGGNGGGGGSETSPPPTTGWGWPAACGRVTSRYGARWGRMHQGVDIACTSQMGGNPPIYASRGGVVYTTNCGSGYGLCVMIDHLDGDLSLYAHMSSLAVGAGSSVEKGQVIGREGSTGNSTGPHLHFEIWKGGSRIDPCPHIGC